MKKIMCLVFIIVSLVFIPSCSSNKDADQSIARDFIQTLYGVDSNEIAAYKSYLNTQDDQYLKDVQKKLKSDTTDEEYQHIIQNRIYLVNLKAAVKNNCTLKPGNIALNQTQKDNNMIQYNYTVNADAINQGNKKVTQITEKGTIQLKKEGSWKINYVDVSAHSKFISENAGGWDTSASS